MHFFECDYHVQVPLEGRDFYQHSTADQEADYLQTHGLKDNSDRQKQQSVEREKLKKTFYYGHFQNQPP